MLEKRWLRWRPDGPSIDDWLRFSRQSLLGDRAGPNCPTRVNYLVVARSKTIEVVDAGVVFPRRPALMSFEYVVVCNSIWQIDIGSKPPLVV